MASSSRMDTLKRLYAELKKKYSPVVPSERTVLEHFLFGTCLEDASFEAAEAAMAALQHTLSGWNEVRVSSVSELSEMMPQLPDPRTTAMRIKRILNAIFDERYGFDIDDIRKKNLKDAYEKLETIPGGTPFSINYTAQAALGRHGIPVGNGEKRLLFVLGILDEAEVESREITGLNRAITKNQGIEFASLLHQLAALFVLNPESRKVTSFLKAFAPDYRERMPKRRELHLEVTLETPEPVVTVVPKRNMIEMLINDPDFRKQTQNEDEFVDEYEKPLEESREEDPVENKSGKSASKGARGERKGKKSIKSAQKEEQEDNVPASEKAGERTSEKVSAKSADSEGAISKKAASEGKSEGKSEKKTAKKTDLKPSREKSVSGDTKTRKSPKKGN